MDDLELLNALTEAAAGLAEVPADRLDQPVPSCGEWDLSTLIGHVGTVHRWAAAYLRADAGARVSRRDLPSPPTGPEVLDWLATGTAQALEALADTPSDRPVSTWAGVQPASWWQRRLTHETVMHRWDAANALGARIDVSPELAVDGIDELLTVFLPVMIAGEVGDGATAHVHTTDAAGEWLVTFSEDGPTVARQHAKGDLALRGPASALLLGLWGRTDLTDVEEFGHGELVARLKRAAA